MFERCFHHSHCPSPNDPELEWVKDFILTSTPEDWGDSGGCMALASCEPEEYDYRQMAIALVGNRYLIVMSTGTDYFAVDSTQGSEPFMVWIDGAPMLWCSHWLIDREAAARAVVHFLETGESNKAEWLEVSSDAGLFVFAGAAGVIENREKERAEAAREDEKIGE